MIQWVLRRHNRVKLWISSRFFGLLTRRSIDADQVGGRIFSRHGRTNFLGLTWQSIDTHLVGEQVFIGEACARKIFFLPLLRPRPHGHSVVNNLCGRRSTHVNRDGII